MIDAADFKQYILPRLTFPTLLPLTVLKVTPLINNDYKSKPNN